jgi:hypothetical protein
MENLPLLVICLFPPAHWSLLPAWLIDAQTPWDIMCAITFHTFNPQRVRLKKVKKHQELCMAHVGLRRFSRQTDRRITSRGEHKR